MNFQRLLLAKAVLTRAHADNISTRRTLTACCPRLQLIVHFKYPEHYDVAVYTAYTVWQKVAETLGF